MTDSERPAAGRGGSTRKPGGRARWPTLDEQLSAAGAAPGSALERLIRDNQELEMLRPEEANDKVRLPPWIRIAWRKRHPDAQYTGPSGGYPLVLENMYEWALTHQDQPGFEDPNVPGPGSGESHEQ